MAKTNQKPDGRGGKRAGAGRKPGRQPGYSPGRLPLSVAQVDEMLDKMAARAKITGKDENDILIDFIQASKIDKEGKSVDIKISVRDRIACIKLWKDSTSKLAEGGEGDKQLGPAVFLPEKHPRLEVVNGDGSTGGK